LSLIVKRQIEETNVIQSIVIIASTAVFSLIGLLAGYLAIRHLAVDDDVLVGDVYVMMMVSTIGGAILGLVVACIAAFIGKKTGDTRR
jgi:hypothetical protein